MADTAACALCNDHIKTTKSLLKCTDCESVYHKRCVKRKTKLNKRITSDNTLKCCGTSPRKNDAEESSESESEGEEQSSYEEIVNKLLQTKDDVINSKDVIIAAKDALIQQLQSEISVLQEQLRDHNTQKQNKHTNERDSTFRKVPPKNSTAPVAGPSKPRGGEIPIIAERLPKNRIHYTENVNKQSRKTDEENNGPHAPTNVEPVDDAASTADNVEGKQQESWTTIVKRPRKMRQTKKNYGNAEVTEESNFQGKDNKNKKIWLCLTKVKDFVTADAIRNYIVRKTGERVEDVIVNNIPVTYKRPDSLVYQVGVRPLLLDEVYKENFWPGGVGYARYYFNFKKSFLPQEIMT